MKPNYIIGIDPDTNKSGYAFLNVGRRIISLDSLYFPGVLDRIMAIKIAFGKEPFVVVVEAGWLNTISNYHTAAGRRGQRIAKNVGANHQVGKIIVQMCKSYGIEVVEQRPLKKMWHGKDGKITREELAAFTGLKEQNNQEERDAALIAWIYAGLPIKML